MAGVPAAGATFREAVQVRYFPAPAVLWEIYFCSSLSFRSFFLRAWSPIKQAPLLLEEYKRRCSPPLHRWHWDEKSWSALVFSFFSHGAPSSRHSTRICAQALNHHPDAAVKRQAEQWLKQFQESADAWTVCDGLLHDPVSTPEVNFLCSQTLKHKVQRDFDDLPAGAAGSLRDSLIALLLKFDEGPVRTQLALAVASLAAHLPAAEWGGVGALQWLATRLTGNGAGSTARAPHRVPTGGR